MRRLKEIQASYDWFFGQYRAEAAALTQANNLNAIQKLEEKRDILDRGFFVLMFGQFEIALNETFQDAVVARADNEDWTRRRGWDVYRNAKRVPFETKLALVLDRNSDSFSEIMETYSTRNHCAHGGTTEPVAIDALASQLYNWQAGLRK